MTTVEIKTKVSSAELLNGVAQLDNLELNQFLDQVLKMHAQRTATSLSAKESELMHQINLGISDKEWECYNHLKQKRRQEQLSEAEHQELIALGDQIELNNARRIKALVELANLRQVTLPELMKSLGITNPGYE